MAYWRAARRNANSRSKNEQVAEIDRRGSSCPIVFVWNGEKYEFLADMIGPGIVGHWTGPNQRNIPDPDEYFKVSGYQVKPQDGVISFKMLEPMEELDYLDQTRLLAIDHPEDVEVYPNERFLSAPPFPLFKVIASQDAHAPKAHGTRRPRSAAAASRARSQIRHQFSRLALSRLRRYAHHRDSISAPGKRIARFVC